MRKSQRDAGSLLLVVGLAIHPSILHAASLRSHVAIHGENVRLSDLFAGLSPGQDCEIGPSPAPGKRVVVPPMQLSAIASEFGVDWQPGAGYVSSVIERQARSVTSDEILGVLRPALLANGLSPEADISLSAFVSPLLPVEMTAVPELQTLDHDAQTGRFAAVLLFEAPNAEPVTFRVVGRTEQKVSVLALAHAMPAGSTMSTLDVRVLRVAIESLHGTPLTSPADVVGMALKHPLANNEPLMRDMLIRPMLVERGRPVVLRLEIGGLALTAAGTALEGGVAGDSIHVVNTMSRAILVGQIMDSVDIQIEVGTAPLTLQANRQQQSLPQVPAALSGNERSWSGTQEAGN
ncbi:flagellar basal body P-ring formation chaperone FlgA [Lichenicola sp.]|uniref:flagellar basal body P-ring formation chaperone FlgA n=1 Tax=Lichenicola sp. TaxID=2804529 RepID=UPI003B00AE49